MVRNLADIVCCPGCHGDLEERGQVLDPDGNTKSCALYCGACGRVAGVISNYRYDFLYFDREVAEARAAREGCTRLDQHVRQKRIAFDDPRLAASGQWELYDGKYLMNHGVRGDQVRFTGEFLDAGVRLLTHTWGGIVRFSLDGELVREVNLYATPWPTVAWFPIASDLAPGPHTVGLTVTGRQHTEAHAAQVMIHELVLTVPCGKAGPVPEETEEVNRVLPVFPRAVEMMGEVAASGRILDCGGGDRTLADARYVNVDAFPYQLADMHADAMQLPFKDESFDLVISQAMLEHVRDPLRVAREMMRVTKMGGAVWVGMAFMQPFHAVPDHYFNATPSGIEELFREWPDRKLNWFGDLSFTLNWLIEASGAAVRMPAEAHQALVAQIQQVNQYVTWDGLRNVASGVEIEVRKRFPAAELVGKMTAHLAEGTRAGVDRALALIKLLPAPGAAADDLSARAIHNAAFAAEAFGDFEKCIRWFEYVLEYQVEDCEIHSGAWFRTGKNLERLSRWREARSAYERALATTRGWPYMAGHAHHRLACLAYSAEEYERAYSHYQLLSASRPDDLNEAEILLDCARSARLTGRVEEARDLLERLRRAEPTGLRAAEANMILAEIHEAARRSSDARACYLEIISNSHCELALKATAEARLRLLG